MNTMSKSYFFNYQRNKITKHGYYNADKSKIIIGDKKMNIIMLIYVFI